MAPLILAFVAVAAALVAYFVLRPASCATSADCPPGESCDPKGLCAATGEGPGPGPQKCEKDADCPKGGFCDPKNGYCWPTPNCPSSGKGKGPQVLVGTPGGSLTSPAQVAGKVGRKVEMMSEVLPFLPDPHNPKSGGFLLAVGGGEGWPSPEGRWATVFKPQFIGKTPLFTVDVAIYDTVNKRAVMRGPLLRDPGSGWVGPGIASEQNPPKEAIWAYHPQGFLTDPDRSLMVKAVPCGEGGRHGDPLCAAIAQKYPGAAFSRLGLEAYDLSNCLTPAYIWAFEA